VLKHLESLLLVICRAIIASAFWLASRFFYKVEVHGLENDAGLSRTYYGMLHKRDLDPIVIVPTVVFHRGLRELAGGLHFALRSDGFSPGYLGRLVMYPRWLSRALRLLSIGSVLRWLGAYPLQDLLRPSDEWIREALLLGFDRRVNCILSSDFIEELAVATGEQYEQIESYKLSQLLDWRYHHALQGYHSSEIFVESVRGLMKRRVVVRIKKYLADLTSWMSTGGSLFGSPEGHLSPDGKISPVNSGLLRLLRRIPPDTRIVPISIIYDYMTVGRKRIFIDFAPTIENAPVLLSSELKSRVHLAWLLSTRFTSTQLSAGFLVNAKLEELSSFTLDDLTDNLYSQAVRLAKAGRNVDQYLLKQRQARKRAASFLAFAERHALIRRIDNYTWSLIFIEAPIQILPREVGYDLAPLMYAWNEFQEMYSIQ
jgi:hypothetical protein